MVKAAGTPATDDAEIVAVAPGVTALGVEQRRTPGVAEPAGHRAELVGIGGHERAARKQHAVIVAAGQPAVLGFGAEHPVRRELIVEAALHAAEEAGVAALQGVVTRKGAADMAADIEAGPVIDDLGRGIGRRLGVRVGPAYRPQRLEPPMAASAAAPSRTFFIRRIPVTNVADTNPNNVTSFRLLCGNCPRHRWRATVTAQQQSDLVPSHVRFFPPLIEVVSRLVDVRHD